MKPFKRGRIRGNTGPRALQSADVQISIRAKTEPIDSGSESPEKRKNHALIFAIHLFQKNPCEQCILEIANDQLSLERPEFVVGDFGHAGDGLGQRVGEPHCGRVKISLPLYSF